MGDIIQSTALFKKIKFFYPKSIVTLIVSTEFYEITPFLPYIDDIRQVNLKGITEMLKSTNFEFNSAAYEAVNDAISDEIKNIKYDIAINLSHDEFSVYFLYMLNSKRNIGISITREGNIVSNDKMIAYLFSAVRNRKASVLNLVDIYTRCLDGLPENRNKYYAADRNEIALSFKNKNIAKFKNNLKEYGIRPDKGDIIVSFAIGASIKSKRWHMDYFAALARMLLNYSAKIKIVLLGAPYDIENGLYIEKKIAETETGEGCVSAQRLINLTGKTSIAGLIYTVGASKLLITHDTGTMHIGVGLHKDLIVIYTGHVGFMETGPYAENMALVTPDISCFPCDFHIKCMNQVCKNLIKPEYIFDIAKTKLEKNLNIANISNISNISNNSNISGVSRFSDVSDFADAKKYFSKYKNSGIIPYISRFDANGFIDFLPAAGGRLTLKALKLRILKLSLEYFYIQDFKLNSDRKNKTDDRSYDNNNDGTKKSNNSGNNGGEFNNNDGNKKRSSSNNNNNGGYDKNSGIHHEVDLFIDCFSEVTDIYDAYDAEGGVDDEISTIDNMLCLCEEGMDEAKNMVNIALNDPLNLKKIDNVMTNMKSIDYNLQHIASPYDELCLINYIHVINLNSTVSYDIFGMAVDSLKNYSGYKHQLLIFKKIWSLFFDKLSIKYRTGRTGKKEK
jgi:ADP-heptose:LPS heptosyltransferase